MTIGAVLTLVLCGGLLILGTVRLLRIPAIASTAWWAYTQTFILAAAAKLARTPGIADRWTEPALYELTGGHNIPTLIGMTLGALVSVPAVLVMLGLIGRSPSLRLAALIQAVIAAAMAATFAMSQIPRSAASSFVTATVPMPWTVWTWSYWGIFLGVIGIAGAINLTLAVRAYLVVRSGTFAIALLGWAATAGLACLYILNKVANLVAQSRHASTGSSGWYLDHAPTVSLALLLGVVAAFVATLAIYPLHRLPSRYRRYKTLLQGVDDWRAARDEHPDSVLPDIAVPQDSRRAIWKAAADPLSAYSLQVELADTRQ